MDKQETQTMHLHKQAKQLKHKIKTKDSQNSPIVSEINKFDNWLVLNKIDQNGQYGPKMDRMDKIGHHQH
jgi:hypothetical protein